MAPPPKPHSSSNDPLPAKENATFKKIVKCYEQKQYKAGLKLAKQILSVARYGEHGETLCMKGLLLNAMGKREEGQADVKRGLRADLQSHVCWHVYGLIQRSDKKYDEAIKAYRNALKFDKENMQILRDLSLLQIQMRDLEGYRDTRYQLLVLRPTQRASWIGYAMSYHLIADYVTAQRILEEFISNQKPDGFDTEHSELLLYTNMVMREAGLLNEAVAHLEENAALIYDKQAYLETKAKMLYALNRLAEASNVYTQLIDRNPENVSFYVELERCRGLSANGDTQPDLLQERRLALYDNIAARHPRAAAPARVPLQFVRGARFIERLKPYLINGFRKGVPAMFQQLRKCIYTDPAKIIIVEQMMLTFVKALETTTRFPDDTEAAEESPTTVLWVYYFLAQHYDAQRDTRQAHWFIDRALSHTPTLIELLVSKAKFYKHSGDFQSACRYMEAAQSMDTADRFINSKCAKYMLRAGLIHEAEQMCAKFTREGVKPMINLNEMQCMWFETECAKSFRRRGQLGEALKKCHEVERHMSGIIEDQFDFHTYCIRKMTLCAYVRMLRLEDTLRQHNFYYRAAKVAIKVCVVVRCNYKNAQIYLDLHDRGYSGAQAAAGGGLSAGEQRKLARKMKKRQQQEEANEPVKPVKTVAKPVDIEEEQSNASPLDPDQLVRTDTPLEEAAKFARPLVVLQSKHCRSHTLAFAVYLRLNKPLPMLQCLITAGRVQPDDAHLHVCRVQFLLYRQTATMPDIVRETIEHLLPVAFVNTHDVRTLNDTYREAHNLHLPALCAYAESLHAIESSIAGGPLTALQYVRDLLDANRLASLTGVDWKSCKHVIKCLQAGAFGGPLGVDEVDAYKQQLHRRFSSANWFAPPPSSLIDGCNVGTNGLAERAAAISLADNHNDVHA